MLNLGFQTFRSIVIKSTILVYFLCAYSYLFELTSTLLTFGDKGERVLTGPFRR